MPKRSPRATTRSQPPADAAPTVNGEEVNGGARCTPAQGYLALEAEGAKVEFRNLRIRELP